VPSSARRRSPSIRRGQNANKPSHGKQAAQLDEDRRAANDRREHAKRIDPDDTDDDNARQNQRHT